MAVGASAANLSTPLLNLFRGTNFTAYAGVFVKAHVGDPGAAGTANPSAGSTTRPAATFAAPSGNSIALTGTKPAWTNGGTTETLTHISLWDAATSGNFIQSVLLPTPVPWVTGQVATLDALTATGPPVAA